VYDRKFYDEHHDPRRVDAFFETVAALDKIVKGQHWNLELKFNAGYAGFKHGFFNAFGVSWYSSKSFAIFVRVPKGKGARAKKLCPYPVEYDERWKQLYIEVTDNVKPKRLVPLLTFAHEFLMGQHPE
jgi:hypothetical protein